MMKRIRTFENLTIYRGNFVACNAALQFAESKALRMNPLYIFGNSGLGKTHLLQAVRKRFMETNCSHTICDVNIDENIVKLKTKLENGYYRNPMNIPGLLILDNMQFLAGRCDSQHFLSDLIHILYEHGSRILLAGSILPQEMKELYYGKKEGPIIRTVKIAPPDLLEWFDICRNLSRDMQIDLSDEVLSQISTECDGSICTMEGALTTVSAYGKLMNTPIDYQLCNEILDRFRRHSDNDLAAII